MKQHPFLGWGFRGQVWVIAARSEPPRLHWWIYCPFYTGRNLSFSFELSDVCILKFYALVPFGGNQMTKDVSVQNMKYTNKHFWARSYPCCVFKQDFGACLHVRFLVSQPVHRPHVCLDWKHDPDTIPLTPLPRPFGWNGHVSVCVCVYVSVQHLLTEMFISCTAVTTFISFTASQWIYVFMRTVLKPRLGSFLSQHGQLLLGCSKTFFFCTKFPVWSVCECIGCTCVSGHGCHPVI